MKNSTTCDQGHRESELLMQCFWECKMAQMIWSVIISLKIKHSTTVWPAFFSPGHLYEINENLCSHKNSYMNVYNSFIHSSPKLEQPGVLQWVKSSMESYSTIKSNRLMIYTTTWMNLQRIMMSIYLLNGISVYLLHNILEMIKLEKWRID